MVIAEQPLLRTAWRALLTSMGITDVSTVSFKEAIDHFRQSKPQPVILIADVDLQMIEQLGPQTASSEVAVDALQRWFPNVARIPTLCIKDVRIRRSKTKQEPPRQQWLFRWNQQPEATPLEEAPNPLEARRSLSKPFKNSTLIEMLRSIGLNEKQAEPTVQENTIAEPERRSDLSSISTLLVDDNPINRKVVARMLAKMNIHPQMAVNGREAYEAIEAAQSSNAPIQLVFMDVWMPEMNGLEATAKIRKELMNVTLLQPYIIAMTACVMPGDREKCLEAGMNGYVSKPIRKEELEAAVYTFTQLITEGSS
ncbi:CheY-like superfamily [Fennellomyces sp. T-0311]|nr:CheY-like superfamily [Fennellomyces sp. T-0311]